MKIHGNGSGRFSEAPSTIPWVECTSFFLIILCVWLLNKRRGAEHTKTNKRFPLQRFAARAAQRTGSRGPKMEVLKENLVARKKEVTERLLLIHRSIKLP